MTMMSFQHDPMVKYKKNIILSVRANFCLITHLSVEKGKYWRSKTNNMVGLYQLFYWVELGKIEFYCPHFDIFDGKSIKKSELQEAQ